ncbi:uncharacterized protein LOC133673371 [Populus nigra]|uniref:uncharacterized protein LOC133673371 n=1 Tax=Populus nigra TaxID=3691 RepID=UPI002B269306|nr:uncharacterized protein LOC133673371 [Populus nigra]XP_061950104.1 uncharacterized protein LOC133673371 [Populus nigra]XP_061950106.1 uncharacterized protein LOC133673371 [Populus nigra]XP_061950107.1 uncharacterized protein LOC133673371 [Populus nigra]XP_061950108.1 uncharacterized protein LOC133673371 [Populus nigra]XP_061950109.1 uncharacterized protein LOC133673371 [Populus nigra]XP_061950110.1 uncharacterized protein LOC133673371 [Populus nigra]
MDGSSSGGGNGYRVEAERWLSISEKLLAARDLHGAKSFAIRSRESDPRLYQFADQIIAVADTLLAGELCVENNHYYDYYTILQLGRFTQDLELIANQYRKLALLLNPTSNRLLFADQAFELVSEAWLVLSNPAKKAMYDHELQPSQLGLLVTQQLPPPLFQQQAPYAPEPIRPVPLFTTPRMPESSIRFPTQPKPLDSPRPHAQQRNHPEPTWRQPQQKPTEPTHQPTPLKAATEPTKQSTPQRKPTEPTQQPTPLKAATEPTKQPTLLKAATEPPKQSTPSKTPKEPTWPEVVIGLTRSAPKRSVTGSTRRVTKPKAPTTAAAVIETTHVTQSARKTSASEPEAPSFWTACPYCYILYEYPKAYEECILRCQSCRRAFHAVMVPAPPVTGKDACFCCWGFFPLGFSGNNEKGANGFGSNWSPFSAMFATPFQAGDAIDSGGKMYNKSKQKVIYKDDVYIDISDPSEEESDSGDEWGRNMRKKAKNAKGKGTLDKKVKKLPNERLKEAGAGTGNIQNLDSDGRGSVPEEVVGKGEGSSAKKKAAKDLERLDLNVMFSNDVDEAAPGPSQRNGPGNEEEDNIEGIGFFEGLDEFLSTLPILSVVGDEMVKAT